MNTDLILSFSLLFAATIALICAVYVYLGNKERLAKLRKLNEEERRQ